MSMIRKLLLGYPYWKSRELLDRTEHWSFEDLKALQDSFLLDLLLYAARNIPYYREIIRQDDLSREADPHELLQRFPLIGKDEIRDHLDKLSIATRLRGVKGNSGGSTGRPVIFYADRFVTRQREKAFMHDQWKRVGYLFGDRIFNIRGRTPPKDRFIQHDPFLNIYYASSFSLNETSLDRYLYHLHRIKPHFLLGYPSTMYQLARLMEPYRARLNLDLKAVLCGSEKLFDYQRQTIESVFDCRAYSWYGQSECVTLAGECEQSQAYHVYPQYGYTEFIPTGLTDEKGREIFEVAATGFNNRVMPFIRYRCGDYAVLADRQECACGRNHVLIDEIIGREQEFVIDAQGAVISATSLIFGQHFEIFEGIKSMQLHQDTPGKIEVILVKNEKYRDALAQIMKEKVEALLGDELKLGFSFADEIPSTQIGKARLVNQELDIKKYFGY